MARKFFLVAAGMFLLALSYHFGASTATAQAGSSGFAIAVDGGTFYVMTPNGDVYSRVTTGTSWRPENPLASLGNFWSGSPTPALHESWGQVKARYRSTPGMTVTPGADNR